MPFFFGKDKLNGCDVVVCLKFLCTTHDVLQSRGREFSNIGLQRLTQC
jgi:hypothetical protein